MRSRTLDLIPQLYRAADTRLTAILLFSGAAPIAFALAALTHFAIFPLWVASWVLAGMARGTIRRIAIIGAVIMVIPLIAWLLPPPNAPFFMVLVMLFANLEQLDASGHPNAFNLVGVIFPALCCLVLSANIFLFIALLAALIFYVGVLVLRLNDMPLSGLRIRLVPILLALSGSLFFAVLAFILLPRIDASRIPGLAPPPIESGLTDNLDVSGFADLIQDDTIAFRALTGVRLGETRLYWRVYLLTEAGNAQWERTDHLTQQPLPRLSAPRRPTGRLAYEVRHADAGADWFPILGAPPNVRIPSDFRINALGEIAPRRVNAVWPQNMRIESHFADPFNAILPRSIDTAKQPRLRAYGASLAARFSTHKEILSEVLRVFASEGFGYSLAPPILNGARLDDFFFRTRSGYCSHYAMALATILRAAKIPANVVVGYAGGVWNEYGSYFTIRNSDAHAWVEYEAEPNIWVSVDPTSFVPQADGGLSRGAFARDPMAETGWDGRWTRTLQRGDALMQRLAGDILLYDADARRALLAEFDMRIIASFLGLWLGGSLIFGVPLIALRQFLRGDAVRRSDADFIALARRGGYVRGRAEGRFALAQRWAENQNPETAKAIVQLASLINKALFAPYAKPKILSAEIAVQLRALRLIARKPT